jgi:hypothetical protein
MPILTLQIQRNWRDFEASANFKLLTIRIVISLRPREPN